MIEDTNFLLAPWEEDAHRAGEGPLFNYLCSKDNLKVYGPWH